MTPISKRRLRKVEVRGRSTPIAFACVILLAIATSSAAQEPAPAATRPLFDGVRVNSVTTFVSAYSLQYPGIVSTQNQELPSLWLTTGGTEADVSWELHSSRSEVLLHYGLGYSRNFRFDALNGFDHALSLS